MAQMYRSKATLRVMGDILDPDEVTRLLGAVPTVARKKGAIWHTPNGREMTSQTGMWRLRATDREPEDPDGQVSEILGKLTSDLDVWEALSRDFKVELFCGWFMKEGNEGVAISPETLSALGVRGIVLELDIYDASLDRG